MTRPAIALLLTGLISLSACAIKTDKPSSTAPHPKCTLGPDTTVISSPLNPDGTPNYLAALNAQVAIGVTPANNAAIPLLEALGPQAIIKAKSRPQVYAALYMDPLPDKGTYFIDLDTFVRQYHRNLPKTEANKPIDFDNLYKSEYATTHAPWNPADYPMFAAWLQANDRPFAQIIAATTLPHLYVPRVSNRMPHSFTDALNTIGLGHYASISTALIIRSMLEVHNSDIPAARTDLNAVHRLARLEAQDPFYLSRLVAFVHDTRAFHADQAILRYGKLTPLQARAMLADLRALSELPYNDAATTKAERLVRLDLVMPIIRGNYDFILQCFVPMTLEPTATLPPTSLNQTDWNITLRSINSRLDAMNDIAHEPLSKRAELYQEFCRRYQALKLPEWSFEYSTTNSAATQPDHSFDQRANRYIKELAAFLTRSPSETVPAYSERIAILFANAHDVPGQGQRQFHRATTEQRLTTLAAALAVYFAEYKTYPESLDFLKNSACLPTLPLDPFSGKPFIYHPLPNAVYRPLPTGYILYSVGDNGTDDGGKDHKAGADDIVLQLP